MAKYPGNDNFKFVVTVKERACGPSYFRVAEQIKDAVVQNNLTKEQAVQLRDELVAAAAKP